MIAYILIACLAIINVVQCKNEVPVLMWNSRSDRLDLQVPALKSVPASEFYENVLKKSIEKDSSPIAVFVEQSLSLEDFGWEDEAGQHIYPQVQKDFEAHNFQVFLPYVSQPLDALQSLANDKYVVSTFDGKTFPDQSRNVFLIKLDDAKDDENRPKLLRRHDNIIHDMCTLIQKKYGSATCVLTAFRQSWFEPEHLAGRRLLQAEEETKSTAPSSLNVYYYPRQPLGAIYTKNPPVLLDLKTNTSYQIILDGLQQITQSQSQLKQNVNITVKTSAVNVNDNTKSQKVTLNFVFISNNNTYRLDYIQLIDQDNVQNPQNNLQSTTSISTSIGYSYHTPSTVVFKNQNYELTFQNLQVELYKTARNRPKFSVADDTVPFFTIPIWTGIFVTSILITIVLVGLSMIFDIKTMDQFDDPKGKTVTINATD